MVQKMLIDASHPEETRVAVVDGNKLEDFDYETQAKKQLRGNIYLAKVTRVEPSLQAAFVEYGGNRHGFLAFNEIHPDYYQIPFEDRQKLLEAEAREADDAEDEDEETSDSDSGTDATDDSEVSAAEAGEAETAETEDEADSGDPEDDAVAELPPVEAGGAGQEDDEDEAERIAEQAAKRRRRAMRSYKIQEVIKRRQVLLVQVVKEERGNKGAALTTYLSLAGRYCVLMPNTSRGGGISRKISDNADRRRLKEVVESLNLPEGMGVIIRTAGFSRTKAEIKRDYEYLLRLWERIREETLKSSAPALIYEEGNLIKRAIRDLYDKEIDAILVEGDEAYRQAKDFMRVLIPSHAKKVQPYKDRTPLFMRHGVEQQIDQVYQPVVQLKSGGYLVINQTEALVAVDVNSGRSTRERNIEATALKTNLEAADEACRQMRLRDLAGLIVIDFIDMEENRNNRAVEKRLRDALKVDRSRVQVGRISQFGLLEMSRQRRRASVFEGSNEICPHCNGTGFVRSSRSAALGVLRALEEEALKRRSALVRAKAPASVALYLLNEKRGELQMFESQFGMRVYVESDESLTPPDFKLERLEALSAEARAAAGGDEAVMVEADADVDVDAEAEAEADEAGISGGAATGGGGRRRGRRRRGRKPEGRGVTPDSAEDADEAGAQDAADEAPDESGDEAEAVETKPGSGDADGEARRKRRRRGRRGGRGRRKESEAGTAGEAAEDSGADDAEGEDEAESPEAAEGMQVLQPTEDAALTASDTSSRSRRRPRPAEIAEAEAEIEAEATPEAEDEAEAATEAEPETSGAAKPESVASEVVVEFPETATASAPAPAPEAEAEAEKRPAKRGWWQRRSAE